MSPSSKRKPHPVAQAAATAGKLAGTVAFLVCAAVLIVPVGAFFLIKWAAGMAYDAMAEPNGQE